MKLVQQDDTDAFAQLYDRHGALALRVARNISRTPERAEDAVQEGFLSIWRNRSAYDPESGTFKSWCVRIVRNRAVDTLRRDSSGVGRLVVDHGGALPPVPSDVSVHEEVVGRTRAAELRVSLARLPAAQAEVLALAFYGELTCAEIAERLSVPQGTVKGRMRLGLEKLRRQMHPDATAPVPLSAVA